MPRTKPKPVTKAEIATAVAALKLNTPIRAASRRGSVIILHTRSGDFEYRPKSTTKKAAG